MRRNTNGVERREPRYQGAIRVLLTLVLLICVVSTATAQRRATRIQATAIAGEPFGVASISFPTDGDADRSFYQVTSRDGRTFYPVFAAGPARRLLTELLGGENGGSDVRLHFLFTGREPLQLQLHTPEPIDLVVAPQESPRQHDRLLQQWWRAYHSESRTQKREGDYPPVLQDYLTTMLARRLRLSAPLFSRVAENEPSETQETLELLLGVERLRSAMTATTMRGERPGGEATLPPPAPIEWPEPNLPPPTEPVDIEPLARRTPRECLYLRFGSFANYLWIDHLMEKHGGDLSRMAMLRGQHYALTPRIQRQLVLKKTALSELLGDQVISDMAVIARDVFLQEGASLGVLFQARSSALLGNNLQTLRQEALADNKDLGATVETVKIAGRDVSFLSTPDNSIRSFYVVDGSFHLVTSSRTIVERFLTAQEEKTTLADTPEFAWARLEMPTDRNDTVFIFVSRHFLQGLVSPKYQIELQRRLASTVDMQLLELARMAAANERQPAETVAQLIRTGFLPNNFGQRPDGSGLVATDDDSLDSLRGRRGSFLPIADVDLLSVTEAEANDYAEKANSYVQDWKQVDPLVLGVQRRMLENGRERITIDGRVNLLDESKYGWLISVLGPPNYRRVTAAPGDIVNVQASLQGGLLSGAVPPHELFLGIQDSNVPLPGRPDGFLKTLQIIASTPGYLGSWPKAGYLDWLPFDLSGSEPDVFGFSRLPMGLWRRQWEGFSALSFQRPVLEHVTPAIEVVEDPTPAQLRVQIGDLSTAEIRHWINRLYFDRAKQTTIGNLRLMHFAAQQFGLPANQAKPFIEQVLDGRLVCSLDGEYQLKQGPTRQMWTTTALDDRGVPVDTYSAPIMSWFRGLSSHLLKDGDALIVRAELDMAPTRNSIPGLSPLLRALGGGAKPADASKPQTSDEDKKKPNSDARDF